MADCNENTQENTEDFATNDHSDTDEPVQQLHLDLGDDLTRTTDSNRLGFQSAGTSGKFHCSSLLSIFYKLVVIFYYLYSRVKKAMLITNF